MIIKNNKSDKDTTDAIVNLIKYSELLGRAIKFILNDTKTLNEDEDDLMQEIEAVNYQNKLINDFNKVTANIDEIVKYCIVLAEYIIPKQEEILEKWHDNRIED